METTPKHFERIYRAMGTWTQCRLCNLWRRTDGQRGDDCHLLPDPLTDWSAFGEIKEWAEKWAAVQLYRLEWSLGWRAFEGKERRTWYATITHRNTIIANTSDDDFRTAVLAALESAIGGEQ